MTLLSDATKSVWPSGTALVTAMTPIAPVAPARLSTSIG